MKIIVPQKEVNSLLTSKKYLLYWIASLFSNIGTWMQQVAQPWVMLSISHSSFLLGLDSFALNAPGWIFSLWGGALADKYDRKKLILYFQSIQFVAVLLMAIFMSFNLLNAWIIIFVSLVVGLTDALSTPAIQTIIPSLVKKEEIPRAISLNAIQFNLSRTLGPALAGLLMVRMGALTCFWFNIFSYMPFFFSIIWIYPSKIFTPHIKTTKSITNSLSLSLLSIFKNRDVMVQIISTFIIATFCSPLIIFSPVLIKDIFKGEAKDFGITSVAYGIGGIVGALLSYIFSSQNKKSKNLFYGIILGVAVLFVGFNTHFNFLVSIMVFVGVFLTITNNKTNSQLQLMATEEQRGQYSSLFQLSFRGGLSLGALVTGLFIANIGVKHAFVMNGLLLIFLHLSLFLYMHFKHFDKN